MTQVHLCMKSLYSIKKSFATLSIIHVNELHSKLQSVHQYNHSLVFTHESQDTDFIQTCLYK